MENGEWRAGCFSSLLRRDSLGKSAECICLLSEAEQMAGPDPELAATMGFSGFGKKARTFDFTAMFEQTRRTAVERSRKILGRPAEGRLPQSSQGESLLSSLQNYKVLHRETYCKNREMSSSESEDSLDEEFVGPPLPPEESVDDSDEELIGPPLPPGYKNEEDDDDDDDDDDESAQEEDEVSALGLDPSGARLITGGYDYDVKFWDFAGMDASLQAFRSLQPCECHQIKSLQYSSTGDVILVVAGNSQAKVLDRDGFPVMECVKGDQYIVDMANTKGHTAMLNSGCWHPKLKEEFLTCSNDG
ncbi:WD repeat-containing protein 70, partial [Ophiophagus hannah]